MGETLIMRTFDPWIGNRYFNEGINGKRLLILGESHYGGKVCHYPSYTIEVIKSMALVKGSLPFFSRIQRLVTGGRGGFTNAERENFWNRVAFYNFIQTSLDKQGLRPTYEMWQAGTEPYLQTLQELSPNIILVLGAELNRHLPSISGNITICDIQHPSAIGFSYAKWQPKVLAAIAEV